MKLMKGEIYSTIHGVIFMYDKGTRASYYIGINYEDGGKREFKKNGGGFSSYIEYELANKLQRDWLLDCIKVDELLPFEELSSSPMKDYGRNIPGTNFYIGQEVEHEEKGRGIIISHTKHGQQIGVRYKNWKDGHEGDAVLSLGERGGKGTNNCWFEYDNVIYPFQEFIFKFKIGDLVETWEFPSGKINFIQDIKPFIGKSGIVMDIGTMDNVKVHDFYWPVSHVSLINKQEEASVFKAGMDSDIPKSCVEIGAPSQLAYNIRAMQIEGELEKAYENRFPTNSLHKSSTINKLQIKTNKKQTKKIKL